MNKDTQNRTEKEFIDRRFSRRAKIEELVMVIAAWRKTEIPSGLSTIWYAELLFSEWNILGDNLYQLIAEVEGLTKDLLRQVKLGSKIGFSEKHVEQLRDLDNSITEMLEAITSAAKLL